MAELGRSSTTRVGVDEGEHGVFPFRRRGVWRLGHIDSHHTYVRGTWTIEPSKTFTSMVFSMQRCPYFQRVLSMALVVA